MDVSWVHDASIARSPLARCGLLKKNDCEKKRELRPQAAPPLKCVVHQKRHRDVDRREEDEDNLVHKKES